MMRWLMLALIVVGLVLTFTAKGPGLLGIGLLVGFVGLFGTVFSIAADRVSASARPDSAMATPEDLVALRTRRPPVRAVPSAPADENRRTV
jgi:drug/metabolite transporter (DMT)-like permease